MQAAINILHRLVRCWDLQILIHSNSVKGKRRKGRRERIHGWYGHVLIKAINEPGQSGSGVQ